MKRLRPALQVGIQGFRKTYRTLGSKEERRQRDLQRAWDKAWRQIEADVMAGVPETIWVRRIEERVGHL